VNRPIGSSRLRLAVALAVALAALLASTRLAAAPLDTVRECAAAASPTVYGLKDLRAVCPQLQAALGTLGLDEILYEGWQDKLNVHALRDVLDLAQRYSGPKWHGVPDTASLPAILQSLQDRQSPQVVSWWHSFKSWLKHFLDRSDSAVAKWIKHILNDWLGHAEVSSGFLDAFIYVVTALVAIAAIVLIVRELKAAGVGRRVRRAQSATGTAQNPMSHASATDDETAPDPGSPAGLLRALVTRLQQTGRLATERSLTHRELIARSVFDSEAQKSVFAGVARTAESILYGAQTAAPEFLEQVTRQGRELLMQLSRSKSTP
jgi:hypothetical protein